MKAEWEEKTLGEVSDIINGGTPKSKVAEFWDGNVNWLTPKDMGKLDGKYVAETPRKITELGLQKSSAKLAKPRSVIMSTRAPIGHLAINEVPMAFNQGCRALQPNEGTDEHFLFYYLLANVTPLNDLGTGTTFKELSGKALKEFKIPLPPLAEQKQIVSVLDQAFAGIERAAEAARKNRDNARELFETTLNATFTQKGKGWVETTLGEVCEITHGFAFKGSNFGVSDNEEEPIVLTPGNYSEAGRLVFTAKNTKRFNGEVPVSYLFEVGELTVVMTDLSSQMKLLGKPAFIEHRHILHNQRIGRVIFKTDFVDRKFVYYFLRSRVASVAIQETSTGTMVRHTAPKRILALRFPLPTDRNLLSAAIGRLDQLEAKTQCLEILYQQKLDALEELKHSLLQKAFAGELTVDFVADRAEDALAI